MYNDIWTSPDGITWSVNQTSANVPWGGRASAKAVYGNDVTFDDRNQAILTKHILVGLLCPVLQEVSAVTLRVYGHSKRASCSVVLGAFLACR